MKMAIASILVGLGTLAQIQGQPAPMSKAEIRGIQEKKGGEKLALPPVPRLLPEPKPKMTYAGFLGDFIADRKKTEILAEASAGQPKKNRANVYTDPATDKPKGFVFFAIRF